MSTTAIRLAATALVIAGCSAPPHAAPAATPTGTTTTGTTTTPGELVIDGTARQGALPSCVTFRSVDGRRFVLLDGNVPIGVPVTVRGTPEPGSASYCNAGTPLHVVAVIPR